VRDLNELQRLAEQGHDESQFLLGHHYTRGQSKDINKAKAWLERAAMANNPRAQYYLGELCAELGRGDPKAAYSHMAYWWGKSSNHPYWETMEGMDGRAVSKRRLTWLHMHTDYESASPEETLGLLSELANKYSSPRSAIELGIVYAAGSFLPLSKRLGSAPIKKDAENGFRLIERGLRIIENGSNDIDYNLYSTIGDVYLARDPGGIRTQESLQRGIHYKRKALERARGSDENAALNLKNELAALDQELQQALSQSHEQTRAPILAPSKNPELEDKFKRFHDYFDTLTLEGKRDFITGLDKKLQASPNQDYHDFLIECVEKYKVAHKSAQSSERQVHTEAQPIQQVGNGGNMVDSANQIDHTTNDTTRADFLHAPGAFGDGHEAAHPIETHNHGGQQNDEYGGQYNGYQNPKVGDYDSASYTDRIHTYGASGSFLFGALLYTIGGLMIPVILWAFTDHFGVVDASRRIMGYGLMGVLTILPILPIFALWMIYMASKYPRAPEKSLTGLSIFRVTFFLHLGIIMGAAALMALSFGGDGQALFGLSIFDTALDLVIILGVLALIVLYVTFFYGSLFSMIKGIRDGIYSNMFEALTGVGAFSVINYLVGILVILGALGVILIGVAPVESLPFELPFIDVVNEYSERWFGETASMALALVAFGIILSRAGSLLCTNAVNQFSSGLGEEEYQSQD